jgi:hypothetical protein
MKKTLFKLISIWILANKIAQEVPEYKRSSLSMILLESEDFPFKDVVIKTYNSHPFPDKYNEHNLDDKKFAIDNVNLTEADLVAAGFYKDTLNNPFKNYCCRSKITKNRTNS